MGRRGRRFAAKMPVLETRRNSVSAIFDRVPTGIGAGNRLESGFEERNAAGTPGRFQKPFDFDFVAIQQPYIILKSNALQAMNPDEKKSWRYFCPLFWLRHAHALRQIFG